ncbi:nuclear transport factor 2 family protein [Chitinophaga sp.]|uniref:nuclear transport factor 2 family protein n=1 Tax=Chitinophaga sp. TaxID=1869181 RepID=UPI002F91C9AF
MTAVNNKAIVLAAFKHLIGERNPALIDTYLHDAYIQHSPMVKDGKAGLLAALHHLQQMPPAPVDSPSPVIRTIADGDYVMMHMNVAFMGKKMAIVDLYRLEEGKLAEHWDATQEQPVYAPGDMTMTGGTTVISDLEKTEENKMLVANFFRHPIAAFLAPDYLTHDPLQFRLDKQFAEQGPMSIHRIIGEGDFVLVQSSGTWGGISTVFYDICRMKNNLLAEHWRVMQAIPAALPHLNGMI